MPRLASVASNPSPAHLGATYLGPAEVVLHEADASSPGLLRAVLSDGSEVPVELALAVAFRPAPGDVLLVIGNGDRHYAIGVIDGRGRSVVAVPGDLELRAGGKVTLRGEDGVEIEGPTMEVRVGKLELLARTVTERFDSLRQRVTELLSVEAGQSRTIVAGAMHTRAKSSTLLTEDKVTINGKAIHLG
jgi:hypothetical protein